MAEITALTTGMGLLQWKKFVVGRIPIPQILTEQQRPFVVLVYRILAIKDAGPSANTGEMEAEIDRLVYGLYELTTEEITAVQERLWAPWTTAQGTPPSSGVRNLKVSFAGRLPDLICGQPVHFMHAAINVRF